jgi:hypothetical protein
MLLTIVCMLPDALARLPVSFMTNQAILVGLYGFVIVSVAIDTLRNRRLHPVFGWGGTLILATFSIALYPMSRPQWIAFGKRMVGQTVDIFRASSFTGWRNIPAPATPLMAPG